MDSYFNYRIVSRCSPHFQSHFCHTYSNFSGVTFRHLLQRNKHFYQAKIRLEFKTHHGYFNYWNDTFNRTFMLFNWSQSKRRYHGAKKIIAGLYFVVQLFETSYITPKAQRKRTKIPPALIMISQVLMASLTGVWGIIFATPLVLITIILVQDFYTNPMNEKSTNNAQLE